MKTKGDASETGVDKITRHVGFWQAIESIIVEDLPKLALSTQLSESEGEFIFTAFLPLLDTVLSKFFNGEQNPESLAMLLRNGNIISSFLIRIADLRENALHSRVTMSFILQLQGAVPNIIESKRIDALNLKFATTASDVFQNQAMKEFVTLPFVSVMHSHFFVAILSCMPSKNRSMSAFTASSQMLRPFIADSTPSMISLRSMHGTTCTHKRMASQKNIAIPESTPRRYVVCFSITVLHWPPSQFCLQPDYSLPLGPEFQWHVNLFVKFDRTLQGYVADDFKKSMKNIVRFLNIV